MHLLTSVVPLRHVRSCWRGQFWAACQSSVPQVATEETIWTTSPFSPWMAPWMASFTSMSVCRDGASSAAWIHEGEANTWWWITYLYKYLYSITTEQTPLKFFKKGKMCDSLSAPQKKGPKVAKTGEWGENREEMYQSEEQNEWQAERDLIGYLYFNAPRVPPSSVQDRARYYVD